MGPSRVAGLTIPGQECATHVQSYHAFLERRNGPTASMARRGEEHFLARRPRCVASTTHQVAHAGIGRLAPCSGYGHFGRPVVDGELGPARDVSLVSHADGDTGLKR